MQAADQHLVVSDGQSGHAPPQLDQVGLERQAQARKHVLAYRILIPEQPLGSQGGRGR